MSDREIDEVRTFRREISALYGHDIHGVLDYYRGINRNLGSDERTALSPNESQWSAGRNSSTEFESIRCVTNSRR